MNDLPPGWWYQRDQWPDLAMVVVMYALAAVNVALAIGLTFWAVSS